ncbi:hypothetical protein WA026_007222 [Henosepilachna vigintioctopunctata]|uniref:Uncharacterized protein n=1 Tax=Henosepilachna vigintioctopunctata TaxID=420089 RepID=A0AAW1V2C8_9CUCU
MDSFDVIKHMTPSPKNMDAPPRRVQPYGADQSRVNTCPPKAYSPQRPLPAPQYPYMDQTFAAGSDMGHRFVTGTQQRGETFIKRPANANLTKTRQLQSSSFSGQPSPGRLQSTFVQRPQSAQGYTTFNRPKLSQDIYSSRLNATMEGFTRRPQTANAIMEGYQPHPLYHPNTLGQPQFHGQGSKPAIRLPQSAGMGSTNRLCSTACKSNQLTQSRRAVPTRQELAPLKEFHNLDQNYETLLEIRTPRIQGGNQSNYPFQLSINVTCAERSLLVTPQKRYTVLENNSVYPGASKNNTSCCRCP